MISSIRVDLHLHKADGKTQIFHTQNYHNPHLFFFDTFNVTTDSEMNFNAAAITSRLSDWAKSVAGAAQSVKLNVFALEKIKQ